MYGVTEDLDLNSLVGLEVTQICFGLHQIQIRLDPEGRISIECRLELTTSSGDLVAAGDPESLAAANHLGILLATKIESAIPVPPSAVKIRFDSGHTLKLIDDSDQYESFQIDPGSIVA